jgi:hypothetical protein
MTERFTFDEELFDLEDASEQLNEVRANVMDHYNGNGSVEASVGLDLVLDALDPNNTDVQRAEKVLHRLAWIADYICTVGPTEEIVRRAQRILDAASVLTPPSTTPTRPPPR